MDEDQIIALLKRRLSLEIDTVSVYTGGTGSESLYTSEHVIKLMLDDKPISEVSI